MKYGSLKDWGIAAFASIEIIMLAAPVARAGSLLDEMRVSDTCGTTYADKLDSCTPFHCTKPSPMAMMFGFPSKDELRKMPQDQQQKMRKSMAAAEKEMAVMSPGKISEMKARMVSTLEIKGLDAQGRCQTITMAIPGQRMDCTLDKSMLLHVSEYTRLAAVAKHIQVKSTSHVINGKMVAEQTDTIDGKKITNPWTTALNNGQCKMMNKDADLGWVTLDQMNRMSHFDINLSEHGKHVDGHIQILNSADGKLLFDKDVKTSHNTQKINLKPGTFDIKIVSKNAQLSPVWFRGVKLGAANVFRKNIEFYAIAGTLKLTVNVGGKPSKGAAIYIKDPDTKKWLGKWDIWKKPTFSFVPANVKLPETLTGRYQVFVAPVPSGLRVPNNAKYKDFQLTIKNGGSIEKTINFGQVPVVAAPMKMTNPGSTFEVATKKKFPITDANGMEQNTDRPDGGLIRNFSPASADPALCQKACKDDARCKAWTYVKPNTIQGPLPNCWLKSEAGRAYPNESCISGLVAHK